MLKCFVTIFCYLCPNKVPNSIGNVKNNHRIGLHHQPIKIQYKILLCLSFNLLSETICTCTLLLPHFGHTMIIPPFISIYKELYHIFVCLCVEFCRKLYFYHNASAKSASFSSSVLISGSLYNSFIFL